MRDYSVMIGGKAGEGINTAGLAIAGIFTHLGYHVYMYFDYPSLIRGGHNFAVVRAAEQKIGAHRDTDDILLALDQNCIDRHTGRIRDDTVIIHDTYRVVSAGGHPVDVNRILDEENAPAITRNSAILGAFCSAAGIGRDVLEDVFGKTVPEKYLDVNLRVAGRGGDAVDEVMRIEALNRPGLPVLTGNEVAGLGLVRGGLDTFVAYPMTPTSNLLHFLAGHADDLGVKVIHPENEIAVMLMALGLAYAGDRTAVCTSGGGFCLMTEGLSLAGMSETPVTIVLGQRPGPSTGVPTYTAQGDLHFALNAGQGEFPRFIVAPGDLEEMYAWSAGALSLSWKYQIPSIVLVDKTLAEGGYTFDIDAAGPIPQYETQLWDGTEPYRRYRDTESGISPLAFPPGSGAPVKANSYAHDEVGFTTEDAEGIAGMQEKVLRKAEGLRRDVESARAVEMAGKPDAGTAIVCWGSQKGACIEAAERFDARVVRPIILAPFPAEQWRSATAGADRVIAVENNATGQLARLLRQHGFPVDDLALKYDGRPFSVDELAGRLAEVIG
ncbi:2-oxoacid:acceptor oxidoreductase subunit alpha [Methanoculleus sp. FWC-SCC1]|uniref:2-oxoacid:acceptor oxidoreductase subunit alpha n=1 Tax=Methanoculleus frigidifontis TaxID=2584085 RepID=A0ABT8MB77_9EURY|nr:2-oxoacid:acceptor oxidoreductase subunit alpha [Methanoculleus sp. FWC-SCC1]MDN7025183.1 2-oxoacid:acceptor oxidoreductase subunit alpha [Methanoculleus sp. FWC-SCC1]